LLSQGTEGIDLNVLTLESQLPEEMTSTKSIIKMVQKARVQHTGMYVHTRWKKYFI
jgi:hypothetical protein